LIEINARDTCRLYAANPREWVYALGLNSAGRIARCRIETARKQFRRARPTEAAMTSVRQLLGHKGRNVWSINPDATVFDAIARMAEKDIGSLAVVYEGRLVGIITERHYARNVVLKGKTSPATRVGDIMERRVVVARPSYTIEECMALMTDNRVRHLPILDGKELVGIISIGDLVKSIIDDQKFVIEQLENYIHG
jgi:CBS domain-containing protein